jgi:hypothetical protein
MNYLAFPLRVWLCAYGARLADGLRRPSLARIGIAALAGAAILGWCGQVEGVVFNFSYTPSVTNLPYAAQVEAAVSYAGQQLSNEFSDNITINISVASNTTAFGQSSFGLMSAPNYSTMRNSLLTDAKSTNDSAATATLTTIDPTGGKTIG